MFGNILKKIFGSSNERDLRGMRKIALKIKDLEAELKVLNDVDLTAQTAVLKGRLAQGETLEKLLPDAFALVRETAVRVMGMRHFDVQMIGGITLLPGTGGGCHPRWMAMEARRLDPRARPTGRTVFVSSTLFPRPPPRCPWFSGQAATPRAPSPRRGHREAPWGGRAMV